MKLRKWFAFLWAVLVLMTALTIPAVAAAGDPVLQYELLVDGLDVKEAEPGDIVTVTLYLQRTDANEPYEICAMQSEIRYDGSFFEVVEDSVSLYSGVQTVDIAREGSFREFYMNFLSISGDIQWLPRTRVGSFQLRVIGTEGVSIITNEDYLVSRADGSDGYNCESNELTVILTTDCTVKFQTNGGTPIDPVTAIYGELLPRPEDPAREGKYFAGWFKDIHLTEEWDFATDTVKGNMTLYAKWSDTLVNVPSDNHCIICDRSDMLIPGIPLCWICLLILVLILLAVVVTVYLICRHKKAKKKKTKGKYQR